MPSRYKNRKFCSHKCFAHHRHLLSYDDCGNKRCNTCDLWKPISDFHKHAKGKPAPACKPCTLKARKIWSDLNFDKIKERQWRALSKTENKLRWLYGAARTRAKKKNIPFIVSKKEWFNQWSLQKSKCYYTGVHMTNINGKGKCTTNISIDRIEPEKGYVKGNYVFCADAVNRMKLSHSVNEFLEWIELIYKNKKRIKKCLQLVTKKSVILS